MIDSLRLKEPFQAWNDHEEMSVAVNNTSETMVQNLMAPHVSSGPKAHPVVPIKF